MKDREQQTCKLCSAVFPNLRSLKGHKRTHVDLQNMGPYLCHICMHEAKDKTSLLRHIANHKGLHPYRCNICSRSFTTKSNCERHLRNAHQLSKRLEITSATIYQNSETDPVFGEPRSDDMNSDNSKETDDSCSSEPKAFYVPEAISNTPTNFTELNALMKTKTITENHLQSKPPLLGNNCENDSLQQEPILVPFSAVKSPRCKRFRTERPFSCEFCNTKFTLHPNKERHIRQQHPQYWTKKRYPAPPNIFVERHNLRMSVSNGNSAPTSAPPTQNNNIDLSYITKEKKSDEEISQEFRVNSCDNDLRGLSRNFPESEMEVECNAIESTSLICKKDSLDENKDVVVHNFSEYYKEQESILETALALNWQLLQVIEKMKTASKQQELQFEMSESNFISSSDVPSHSTMAFDNRMFENGAIPKDSVNATCSSESFFFRCHVCDTTFLQRISCLKHIRDCHSEEYDRIKRKGSIENDQSLHDIDLSIDKIQVSGNSFGIASRKIICVFCLRHFWSSEDLRRHVRTHSGQQPFSCEKCLKKFTLKHSLVRHVKQHCKNSDVEQPMPHKALEDVVEVPIPVELPTVEESEEENGEPWLLSQILGVSNETCSMLLSCSSAEAADILGITRC